MIPVFVKKTKAGVPVSVFFTTERAIRQVAPLYPRRRPRRRRRSPRRRRSLPRSGRVLVGAGGRGARQRRRRQGL